MALKPFTVIGLLDTRFEELLVAGVVAGQPAVSNVAPRSGGYERVYYYVEASSPAAAEQAVRNQVESM